MKSPDARTVRILPPPGPLCWLYPELREAIPSGGPPSDSEGSEGTVDLNERGLAGTSLVETLRRGKPRRILVEDGPRGYTLWTWLNQVFRGEGIELPRPSPGPPDLAGDPSRSARETRPLESLLAALSAMNRSREPVRIEKDPGGATPWRSEPLSSKALPAPGGLGLLPLPLEGGLERRLEQVLDAVSPDPAGFRSAGLIPYFPAPPSGTKAPRETRLLPSFWGLLPGDAYPAGVRDLYRELIRILWPDRIFLFMALENYALAGIDLYLESLMGRGSRTPRPPSRKKHRALILGVCGIDGSGKSSHVAALEAFLTGMGLEVKRHKIYRHGVFHRTVTDLTRQCAEGRNLHLWRIQRIVKAFDSVKYFHAAVEQDLDTHDVLLFDRYVYTHFAAGVGRYHHDPFAKELLSVYPPADRIYLMDVPVEEALNRIGTREERTVDENPYMLSRFRHALLDLGDEYGFMVLDARHPFEENRKRILEDAERLVRETGLLEKR